MITQSELKKVIRYDPISGIFTWAISKGNCKSGDMCGWLDGGYIRIKVNKKSYRAHRLAWFYMTGEWPNVIDHIDQNRSNNIFINLRNVTVLENNKNHSLQSNNTSKVTGINYHLGNNKWRAYIYINKKQKSLGYFTDKFEAICARKSADRKFNFHDNHGVNLCLYS